MQKAKTTSKQKNIDFIKISFLKDLRERLVEILQQSDDNEQFMNDKCPKCDDKKLKTWRELSEDEKMTVKVHPSEYPLEERKRHRFCFRCWFEESDREARA